MAKIYKAKIKATGEIINVYRLASGDYYDYDRMGEHEAAQSKTGKKQFTPQELEIQNQ